MTVLFPVHVREREALATICWFAGGFKTAEGCPSILLKKQGWRE